MSGPVRDNGDNRTGLSSQQMEAVRAQLDIIIDDPLFRDTTRMKRFLRYVTEETLAGRGARLKGYTIGLEVFDKPAEFDPQGDTIVRVQAGQLRRRLDLYYAGPGEEDPIRLTIPKGRYAPRFEVRTETPRDVASERPPEASSVRRNMGFPGLAVMSLLDLNPSEEMKYIAEGITAEIVSALVQFRHIRIIALRSTQEDCDPASVSKLVGRDHDVQFVLSGTVRRSANIFRVSVNLSAADSGRILYSQSFDRAYSPDTLFELQESIASNVAATIAAPFGQIDRFNRRLLKGRRSSLSAYETVLRFYTMGLSPNRSLADTLLADLERLTVENPDFSSGFAIRAMLHSFKCTQNFPPIDPEENLQAARMLSDRAIRIDPQNSLSYFAKCQALHHSGDVGEANDMAKRAIMLNPNDSAMLAYFAITRAWMGDFETAEFYDESARNLVADPPTWFNSARIAILFQQEEYERLIQVVGENGETGALNFPVLKTLALSHLDRIEEARDAYENLSDGRSNHAAHVMETLSYWQISDSLRTQMLEGWRKIGIDATVG